MTQRPADSKGQVLALFALFLIVLIGATAVTVDYGTWLKVRRDYQNFADAAALAGGGFLSRPITSNPSDPKRVLARRAAWDSLNAQLGLGLNNGQLNTLQASNTSAGTPETFGGYRLWVSTPPIGASTKYPGVFAGSGDRYVFVWVERDNPSFFNHVFGLGDKTVQAWATAGAFASQFAIVTLRKNGEAGPAAATDIDVAGSNTVLRVVNGDVGGNWGMKLNSSTNLYLTGGADAYLIDYISCGNSCWSPDQVTDGAGNFKDVQQLPTYMDDPNYPLPSVLAGVPATDGTVAVPRAAGTDPGPGNQTGNVTITGGSILGVGCAPGGPHLGPGWYHDINISNNACLVLDPIHNYSDPDDSNGDSNFGMTDVPATQQAGIFYFTGTLNVNNGSLVVADGVSLVLRKTANQPSIQVNGTGAIDINTGASDTTPGFPPNFKKAAFQTDGSYSYTFDNTLTPPAWVYSANNADTANVGVAIYVVTPAQMGDLTADANTGQVKVAAGAAIAWQGVMYAPRDNIELSGQPLHDAIGQFISWTVKLSGGTTVTQTYDGPGESAPRLVEPRLGQQN
ncbi:MAG TPA: pilus assembly protein TadG-related protein [Candidatus Polarisedimenticolia bacterium]|nr:pilus assembly protein TadG-related protein [Candidatus Polarisedimenticolia bacterium]